MIAALLLFFSWLLISSLVLFRFGFAYYGTFDEEQRWQINAPSLTLAQLAIPVTAGWQVVHVLDPRCGCSRFAKEHAAMFTSLYDLAEQQQTYRTAQELVAAGFVIPAVPAVLLFDHGTLIYAGPYASGPLCSTQHSFLHSLISRQTQLEGLWLNGESKACRCLVTPTS